LIGLSLQHEHRAQSGGLVDDKL